MTDPHATDAHVPSEREQSLVRVLDAYFSALQAGQAPDRAEVLAAHPDLAAVLEPRLAALDFIHRTGQAPAGAPVQVGDFRIVREIGRGGMGVVYEAEQISLRRRVALKILRLGEPASPEAVARFRREAEMVARLHHTNIVPIFAVGCEQGVHYFAMQLIEGRSLAAAPAGPLPPPREVAGWGRQAAEALAHAHARSIIHRDVKPSNLLLDGEGVVWLSDFGLARGMDETALTAAGVQPGTPDYMSPEQVAAAAPIDHRTDLYSLGATLYKLATGRRVFEAENLQQLLAQVREDEPVAPRKHRPDLPRDMETIILRCLAKAPDDRYASAQALADDLRAFTEDRPIKARRPSLRERARRWLAGKRFTGRDLARIGVAVATVVVGLVLFGQFVHHEMGKMDTMQLIIGDNEDLLFKGELLHPSHDKEIGEPFDIPPKSPLYLPIGRYRLRLSRPGWLSTTFPLEHERGEHMGIPIVSVSSESLGRQHLWSHSVKGAKLIKVVPSALGHDVIVLVAEPIQAPFAWPRMPAGQRFDAIRTDSVVQRLSGASGLRVWEQKLWDNSSLAMAWKSYMRESDLTIGPVQHGPNLFWSSGHTATLLCQSGKTGELLWRHSVSAPVKDGAGSGFVCGLPQFAIVNEQGEPGLIALVYVNEGACYRLQAVTERMGQVVWDRQLAGSLPPLMSDSSRKHEIMPEPALATVRGRTVAVCVVGGMLHGIDVRTGKDAWTAQPAPYRLLRTPQFDDLNGDGNTDMLLLHEHEPNRQMLTALDLTSGRTLWKKPLPGWRERLRRKVAGDLPPHLAKDGELWIDVEPYGSGGGRSSSDYLTQDWPLLIDLDGDGQPEVVIRLVEFSPNNSVETVGVLVLEGATGAERWTRRLGRSIGVAGTGISFRLLAPATQKGKSRVLIVASLIRRWRPRNSLIQAELYVDALSGITGKSLWWWHRPLVDGQDRSPGGTSIAGQGLGKMGWWKAGDQGEGLVLVPFRARLGNATQDTVTTYLVDGGRGEDGRRGELRHTAISLQQPHTVDLDGDGRPELLGWTAGRSWQPITGLAPAQLAALYRPKAREMDSPSVAPLESTEDPRLEIPLPWNRGDLAGEGMSAVRTVFIILIWLFVWVPIGRWAIRRSKLARPDQEKRLRGWGMNDAEIKTHFDDNSRLERHLQPVVFPGGLLLALAAAVVAIALDEERWPDERYIWTGPIVTEAIFLYSAFGAGALLILWLAVYLPIRLVRLLRIRLRRKSP